MSKKKVQYGYFCQCCRKELQLDAQVLYVEEEMGRYFCSEACINSFYRPIAEYYYRNHLSLRDPHDISESEFEEYQEYGPLTLENPKEVWMDETDGGEMYFYFMAEFSNAGGKFSYVVMCFCLQYEPTYILISFPTRDLKILKAYRLGKEINMEALQEEMRAEKESAQGSSLVLREDLDDKGRAVADEMFRNRKDSDIKREEFDKYLHLMDESVENPDESWELQDDEGTVLLNIISKHEDSLHYIVVCILDQTETEELAWRVVYNFPTNDLDLVERYRRGIPSDGAIPAGNFIH